MIRYTDNLISRVRKLASEAPSKRCREGYRCLADELESGDYDADQWHTYTILNTLYHKALDACDWDIIRAIEDGDFEPVISVIEKANGTDEGSQFLRLHNPNDMSEQTPKFKPGDQVKLKSGGPTMTVQGGGPRVECIWFDDEEHPQEAYFAKGTLRHVSVSGE